MSGGEPVKKALIVIVSLVCALGSFTGAQQPTPGPAKIAVLIVTGQNGHDWRGTTTRAGKVLEHTNKFDVRVTEEFRGAGPETLAPYDLVVLNYSDGGRPERRWGDRA